MTIDVATITSLAAELAPDAIELRRSIHRFPEIGHEEFLTTNAVATTLREHDISVETRESGTGAMAELGSDGPVIGFRADLDALPIVELTSVQFRSETPGLMHACGHDAHTAIGVYTAVLLSKLGLDAGRVRFIFQPAEEAFPGGAIDLLREGWIDDIESLMAFHVDPSIPAGTVGLRVGTITGSSDRFRIKVEGPGGHTARPHETVDTISVAARIVSEVPVRVAAHLDARNPVVLVFGRIAGGQADNVIPTSVELSGTCRTLDPDAWHQLPPLVESIVTEVVAGTDAKVTVEYTHGIPPVVNDERLINGYRRDFTAAFGSDAVRDSHASMGAEDFSYFLDRTRGALVRLGVGIEGKSVDLHSATFDMDESAIERGIAAAAVGLLGMIEDEAATRG